MEIPFAKVCLCVRRWGERSLSSSSPFHNSPRCPLQHYSQFRSDVTPNRSVPGFNLRVVWIQCFTSPEVHVEFENNPLS
jgi:hypothetical protein